MRYVTYEPSLKDKPPRAAVAVRRADDPADIAATARLSARYVEGDSRTALVNAQKHHGQPRNAVFIAVEPGGADPVGYGRVTWVGAASHQAPNAAPAGYYLGGMVVEERYRRRGVGQRLTAERLNFIRGKADEAWYLVNRHNTASIDLHVTHGFHEATTDFIFPGVVFDGPEGVLCHMRLGSQASRCAGCPA